jgi:hypothetical protein
MENLFLTAFAAFLAGLFVGSLLTANGMRQLTQNRMMSVTRLLFVVISFSALSWVFISYAIAIYAMVKLGQVYTMAELAEPAITGLLLTIGLKVLENVFEHNDGPIFGHNNGKDEAA